MSADYGLVYSLWTDPHGPAELLDHAIGDVGLDHLTVPVVTGKIAQFRLNPARPPHYFVSEGGWHFPPQSACYTGGSARPRPARWFGKRDVLGQVCEYAAKRGIPVIFRIDLRSVAGLLEHEPHLRARNAWGDEIISAGACVLNPELRELLRSTLKDLLRYGPVGFQLVDWAPDLASDRYEPRPLSWQPTARKLLDVCFCPACRQTATVAAIDPDQAARSLRVHSERLFAHPENDDLLAKLPDDDVLAAYLQARRRDTAAWLRHLAETHRDHRRYLVGDVEASEPINLLLAESAFLFVLCTRQPLRSLDEDTLKAAIRRFHTIGGLALPVWRPAIEQAGQLVRAVSAATKAGIAFFDFEGLDAASGEAITWLKQAVRFARRD